MKRFYQPIMNSIGRMYPNLSASELSNIILKGKGKRWITLFTCRLIFCATIWSAEHHSRSFFVSQHNHYQYGFLSHYRNPYHLSLEMSKQNCGIKIVFFKIKIIRYIFAMSRCYDYARLRFYNVNINVNGLMKSLSDKNMLMCLKVTFER